MLGCGSDNLRDFYENYLLCPKSHHTVVFYTLYEKLIEKVSHYFWDLPDASRVKIANSISTIHQKLNFLRNIANDGKFVPDHLSHPSLHAIISCQQDFFVPSKV